MVRAGVPLEGIASFHGSLKTATPAKPGSITAKILVCHGEADPLVPPADVEAFKQEMAAAGAALTFRGYPGALHAFSNPEADATAQKFGLGKAIGYDAQADAQSWAELQRFLQQLFEG